MFERQPYLDKAVRKMSSGLETFSWLKKRAKSIDVNMLQLCNFALFVHLAGWRLERRSIGALTYAIDGQHGSLTDAR